MRHLICKILGHDWLMLRISRERKCTRCGQYQYWMAHLQKWMGFMKIPAHIVEMESNQFYDTVNKIVVMKHRLKSYLSRITVYNSWREYKQQKVVWIHPMYKEN